MAVKVSVIIPVYNVEKYLRECIDSILNQTLRDLELICVDDGSTDGSLEILHEYEKADSRVKVLTQHNMGAGAARNKGLAIATGEYLSFLDSDDFFASGLLEESYRRCQETRAEICIYQIMRYNDTTHETYFDKGSFRKENAPRKEVFSYKDMPEHILDSFQNWAWNKLISHDLVKRNGIKFQEIFRTNDLFFVASCMMLAERITLLEKKLVYYRIGIKNNCQSTNYRFPLDFLKAFYAVRQFLEEHGMYAEVERSFVNKAASGCVYNLASIKDPEARELLYNELKETGFEKLGIKGKEKSYFYDEKIYKKYQEICMNSFEEFEIKNGSKPEKRKYLQKKFLVKTENPKVSIIVPIYNVEDYLEECMESIVRQTLEDIEIICINDGSTDSSMEILSRYADNDPRIIVVDKKNEGYGIGMNIGLERATGEYVGIVEPDDYVPLDMYEDLYLKAKEYELDFVKADFFRFKTAPNGNMELVYNHLTGTKEDYNVVFNPSNTPEALRYVMNTWSGIYKNDFLRKYNIRHHETPGASFQDNGFWIQTFCFASRAMILDKPYYMNRRDNPNSSVNSPEKVYCMNEEYKYIKGILSKDPELWYRFKYHYTLKKFQNYIFTLNRINVRFKKQYVQDICDELTEAEKIGELDRDIFAKADREKLDLLLADPEVFYMTYCSNTNVKMKKRVEELESSTTWKVGKAIMYLPRQVKIRLKKNKK